MTDRQAQYEIGKQYRITGTGHNWTSGSEVGGLAVFAGDRFKYDDGLHVSYPAYPGYEYEVDEIEDAVSPNHYQFPGGAEVIDISQWLTANAAQALQYIARSSRIDGKNKGDAQQDIQKAIKFLQFELGRLGLADGA